MGHITIEETTPLNPTARALAKTAGQFSLLKRSDALVGPTNLGGRFALPPEFDSNKLASSFVPQGNAVDAARRDQPLTGTNYSAQGWDVWTYPKKYRKPTGERNPDGTLKMSTKTGGPITEDAEHPNAGQPFIVPSLERDGQSLVLMCRPREVQDQVNEVYATVSREQMVAEISGSALSLPEAHQPTGMLTAAQLATAREIRAEMRHDEDENEQMGRSTFADPKLKSAPSGTIRKADRRVTR